MSVFQHFRSRLVTRHPRAGLSPNPKADKKLVHEKRTEHREAMGAIIDELIAVLTQKAAHVQLL